MAQQPEPGQMILYDDCRPPLGAGDYELRLHHQLLESTAAGAGRVDTGPKALPAAKQQPFRITGPRFRLDPLDIHGVFPPRNSEGPYAGRLPMVVLRRRTLPWERDPGVATAAAPPPPWLALLLLDEDEATLLEPPDWTVGDMLDGQQFPSVAPIALQGVSDVERGQPCLGVELDLERFKAIAPTAEELSLLTHVRQVSTDDKELLGMDEDGWFAVVTGNRLPEDGKDHIACLVSLEGQLGRLPETSEVPVFSGEGASKVGSDSGPATDPDLAGPHIRLFVLARWRFRCTGSRDFEGLMRGLAERGGIGMLGQDLASTTTGSAGDLGPAVHDLPVTLPTGHVPLPYKTREGEETIAWYRGPLSPVGISRDNRGPYHCADQARRVDALTGLEDLGYAAAFEAGRQLALADPRFAVELMRWRRGDEHRLRRLLAGQHLAALLPDLGLDALGDNQAVDPSRLAARLLERMGSLVADHLQLSDPTELRALIDRMPGLDSVVLEQMLAIDPQILAGLLNPDLLQDPLVADFMDNLQVPVQIQDFDALLASQANTFAELLVRYNLR